MRYESIDKDELPCTPCRYGQSRTWFRGPRRALDRPYIAFLGGTATYGKYIETPFPALVEIATGRRCINFGCVNGGIDVFVNDPTITQICKAADLNVVQVMGANHLSNRFYTVHQRRNDRFLSASPQLRTIYPEVDFVEFAFTRHMLGYLYDLCASRFDAVVDELRKAWLARMQQMLRQIGPDTVLLWFSDTPLNDVVWSERPRHLQVDPLFINASMIDRLGPLVRQVLVVTPTADALAMGTVGMRVPASQDQAAGQMLGPACHTEAANALINALSGL
ncbi:DUF6473 family protein [Yoonia sp.]|uniref:DUF6473 family protein n=1 Tax=Yoonia sp. TaxID=2212373 RepID=UPI00391D2D94